MVSLWNEVDEREYAARHDPERRFETEIARQAYATTLLGASNDLTMHGGGNTSVKTNFVDDGGNSKRALYVKSSGTPLCEFTPDYFVVMDLEFLEGLKTQSGMDDRAMAREFKNGQLTDGGRLPSIESLMHAFIPAKAVDHTHPTAILKIANRSGGGELVKKCFGGDIAVIPYAKMGCDLAKAVSEAALQNPECKGVVICHHGLVTWGEDAREAYERTIDIITKAEDFLTEIFVRHIARPDASANKIAVTLLNEPDVMELINSPDGKRIITDPPLTPDYPMSARVSLSWVDGDIDAIPVPKHDRLPCAVVNPKLGALCFGIDEPSAKMTADYVRQAFAIRRAIAETGGVYQSLGDEYLHDMRYRYYQQVKIHAPQ